MRLPTWLTSSLKVPIVRWFIGAIAILIVLLIIVFKMMLAYKRRLAIAREIHEVELDYLEKRERLAAAEKKALKVLDQRRNIELTVIEAKKIEITKAEKSGDSALAELVTLSFGRK